MLALENIRVIDFSRILAGPFCSMILADMGAEVIKIERPGKGDDSRAYGPFVNDESLYFISVNRGKKSIEINLKNARAHDFLLKLIDTADVVVENFKPGVMERLGLSYEALSARNPRLIYASCSGYGQTGSFSNKPAYDLIIQGLTGMMSITGPDAEHPCKVGMSIADVDTGVFAALGVMTALYQREQTGKGQHVDIAMFDVLMAILENAATRCMYTGVVPKAVGNRHLTICPFASIKASDGYFNIAAGNDSLFVRLCEALEDPDMAKDERFLTNDSRLQNWPALEARLNADASKKTIGEWCEIFDRYEIPAGPINDLKAALSHPQAKERGVVVNVRHPAAGDVKCIASPLRLGDSTRTEYEPSPVLGADTADYISEILGISLSDARHIVDNREFL